MSFPPRRHEDTKNILSLCHIDLVAMSGGKNMQKIAKEIRLEDIVEIILRRRWWMIISFCFCIIIGIILAFTLPKYYQADTLVLIQPQKVPKDYVQSVVTMDIDSRIEAFSHEILSRSNLEKIMKNFNMYTEPKYKTLFVEDKIADMRKRINVALLKRDLPAGYSGYAGAYAFTISFQGKDPEKVMKVTNALASYFIDENLRFTETESKGTNTFLEEELNSIRKELAAKEEALKEYREKYMGELPEQLGSNLSMLTRIQEQLKGKETSLLDAKNKLATFMDQIKQGALLFGQGVAVTNDGRIVSDFDKPISLEQAKAMLSYLETRYTSKHPDIIRIKKIISDMEKNKQNNLDASDVAQYIPANAKLEVEQIKANINTLTTDISKLKSQIRDYEKRIDNTPKREQQLKSLERDYNNKRENYNMLLNKKLETQISINMDKSQKGERFQVLDPAMLPEKPVFPNMKMLFLLTLVAGPNIGLGLIFLLEYLDTSFRSPKDIESYLGFSVLSAVPIIADRKYIRRQKLNQVFSVVSILFSFILLSAFAVLSFVGVDQTMELLNQFLNT
jgi:polysaccharide chain length determinant protein (PEP-CTERM system associated)